jgi:predicted transcriptional regulator
MTNRDYSKIFNMFLILSGARKEIARAKLRNKVSCNGVRYTEMVKILIDKGLLQRVGETHYITTETGRSILENWYGILDMLELGDKLSKFSIQGNSY